MVFIINDNEFNSTKSMEGYVMPNKHFCQGPTCHEKPTTDRFLKSRGVIRGRYAYCDMDHQNWYSDSDKFFCSQSCKLQWLATNMTNIEHGRPIEFIRHRRESQAMPRSRMMSQGGDQNILFKGLTIGLK